MYTIYIYLHICIYHPLSQFAEVPMPYHCGSALDGHAAPLSHSLEAVESLSLAAAGLTFYEDCAVQQQKCGAMAGQKCTNI